MNENEKPKAGTPEWRAAEAARKRAARHAKAAAEGRTITPRRTGPRRSAPTRPVKPCGTVAAYKRGCRCQLCGDARRTVEREGARRRKGHIAWADRPIAEHGTYARYVRGCRCQPCRLASSAYLKTYRKRAVAKPGKLPAHGTLSRYAFHKCRCIECRTARSAYERQQARTRAEAEGRPYKPRASWHLPSLLMFDRGCRCDGCLAASRGEPVRRDPSSACPSVRSYWRGCRCDGCRAASNAHSRERYKRK